ncbi:MAG: TPM domain-containing protein, partial [Actinomycetota bacterium]|nr:TPM domain-containing protein [Actinomycetota bacterium]
MLAAVLGVSALVAGLVILAVIGVGVAVATPPLRAADQITDQADALGGDDAQVREALDQLRADDGTQLFLVFVSSFDGLDGQSWADQSAQLSQLGSRDVLFAVALDDRVYGLSIDQEYPLSDAELSDLLVNDVEPQLSEQDWTGAAIALADGLDSGGSGGGGIPIALLLGGVVLAGGGYLVYRRRKQARTESDDSGRAPGQPRRSGTGEAHADPHADLTTQQLTFQASSALIDLDDAVQTSTQELTFAQGQFGDEAVTGFQEALDASRTELGQAFALRQQLDDEVPEAEPAQRKLLAEILRLCQSADQRLDAQSEAFDRLRDLDHTAAQVLEGLAPKVDRVQARLPQEEQRLTALRGRYAATALSAIADDVEQARALLDNARQELDEARGALQSPTPSSAVVSLRTAEDATAQADQLLDGIWRLETELAEAGDSLIAARLETDKDLGEARALLASGDSSALASMVARAETARAAADAAVATTPNNLPDPLTALRQLIEADLALDGALGSAREARAQSEQTERRLDQAMITAQSSLAAAEDFIMT